MKRKVFKTRSLKFGLYRDGVPGPAKGNPDTTPAGESLIDDRKEQAPAAEAPKKDDEFVYNDARAQAEQFLHEKGYKGYEDKGEPEANADLPTVEELASAAPNFNIDDELSDVSEPWSPTQDSKGDFSIPDWVSKYITIDKKSGTITGVVKGTEGQTPPNIVYGYMLAKIPGFREMETGQQIAIINNIEGVTLQRQPGQPATWSSPTRSRYQMLKHIEQNQVPTYLLSGDAGRALVNAFGSGAPKDKYEAAQLLMENEQVKGNPTAQWNLVFGAQGLPASIFLSAAKRAADKEGKTSVDQALQNIADTESEDKKYANGGKDIADIYKGKLNSNDDAIEKLLHQMKENPAITDSKEWQDNLDRLIRDSNEFEDSFVKAEAETNPAKLKELSDDQWEPILTEKGKDIKDNYGLYAEGMDIAKDVNEGFGQVTELFDKGTGAINGILSLIDSIQKRGEEALKEHPAITRMQTLADTRSQRMQQRIDKDKVSEINTRAKGTENKALEEGVKRIADMKKSKEERAKARGGEDGVVLNPNTANTLAKANADADSEDAKSDEEKARLLAEVQNNIKKYTRIV